MALTIEEVGRIYGDVGLGAFRLTMSHPMERGEYLEVLDESKRAVLCQLDDVERRSDLNLEKANRLARGDAVPVEETLFGKSVIVGYREGPIVKVPQIPFRPGSPVYRADEGLIAQVLGLKHNGNAAAYLGLLRNHNLRVELDINSLCQRHVSVLSKTGGGKSYLVGVLLEEFLKHKVTCVIIDPHGEYGSIRYKSEHVPRDHSRFGVDAQGFRDQVQEFSPDTNLNPEAKPLTFSLGHLDARELLLFMGITNVRGFVAPMKALLDRVAGDNPEYTVRDLIRAARSGEERTAFSEAIAERLEYVDETHLLAPRGTSLSELVSPGKMTILNLRGVAPDVQELIVTRVSTSFFEQRKRGKIPPLFLVLEEAHNFCPQQGQALCSRILKTIASEGRKFGLGMCVVSQRPARVDKSVLSQCATQLILQVTNPLDVRAIAQSIEGLTNGMTDIIQALPVGTCLVTGGGFQTPLFCEVRPRASRHGGESVKVVPTN
ncbi:MAG: ATP-binding protein [Euryarchaeota archaeon]|nr:ATP-binding protein [Euryarchaeota archaeon]MDE1837863.1 ATP-binding protein [Euryarchaeota archaeon]MDE2046536.1 ATP-binding protein [Thermoplasmata archaeon]